MLLEAKNISFRYHNNNWILKDVNLKVETGERIGLTGPSGYGKSTLSKILSGYINPTEGQVLLNGKPLPQKGYCPVQLIYQHPEKAVNPRFKMSQVIKEAWEPEESFYYEMGIEKEWLDRFPSELSGGELQRFCVARAIGTKTKFIVADEISTMLDVITQAQIWKLIQKVIEKNNLGMIAVTHNYELANQICTSIVDLREINRI